MDFPVKRPVSKTSQFISQWVGTYGSFSKAKYEIELLIKGIESLNPPWNTYSENSRRRIARHYEKLLTYMDRRI